MQANYPDWFAWNDRRSFVHLLRSACTNWIITLLSFLLFVFSSAICKPWTALQPSTIPQSSSPCQWTSWIISWAESRRKKEEELYISRLRSCMNFPKDEQKDVWKKRKKGCILKCQWKFESYCCYVTANIGSCVVTWSRWICVGLEQFFNPS